MLLLIGINTYQKRYSRLSVGVNFGAGTPGNPAPYPPKRTFLQKAVELHKVRRGLLVLYPSPLASWTTTSNSNKSYPSIVASLTSWLIKNDIFSLAGLYRARPACQLFRTLVIATTLFRITLLGASFLGQRLLWEFRTYHKLKSEDTD